MYLTSNNEPIFYNSEELFLSIYLIGYETQGESIVLIFETEERKAVWSAVIDSYSLPEKNITDNILKAYKFGQNKKIDLACITHFHNDHTTGFKNLLEYYADENTKIMMPEFSREYYEAQGHYPAKEIRDYIQRKYTGGSNCHDNNVFYNRKIDRNLIWDFNGSTHGVGHQLYIESLLPTDRRALHYIDDDLSRHSPNDLSLMLKIVFDGNQYLFTGDCTNDEMKDLGANDFYTRQTNTTPHVVYLKIPHHGSKTADNLLKMVEDDRLIIDKIATCTYDYRATKENIIEGYRKKCDIAMTKDINAKASNAHSHGIIKYVFDSRGNIIDEKTLFSGNATRLWRKVK